MHLQFIINNNIVLSDFLKLIYLYFHLTHHSYVVKVKRLIGYINSGSIILILGIIIYRKSVIWTRSFASGLDVTYKHHYSFNFI